MKVITYALAALCCVILTGISSFSLFGQTGFSQQVDNISYGKALSFPDRLFSKLNSKATSLNRQLDKQTCRYLDKLGKQEGKLYKKIAAKDSSLAKKLFDGVQDKYRQLQATPANVSKYARVYSPGLDSLNTALNFLKSNNIGNVADNAELQKTLASYSVLQSKLNTTQQVRQYLMQRRQVLQQELQQFGMMKELNKFKQQITLYDSQIQEYRNILNDPSKLESMLLSIVQKIPSFREFFAANSLLGSLFALPTSSGAVGSIAPGLQTRAIVDQVLINRFGSMEAVTQALQQAVPSAQSELQQLKNKLNQYTNGSTGNGETSFEMPDYSVNPQQSKSFWKRLVLGTTIQSQRSHGILPITSDLGLSLGFKISDKQTIGVALSEKIGLGKGWNHIKLTQEGIGVRSFLDVKLKGSFWLSAGYELNYRPGLSALDQVVNAHGQQVNLWQKSGLVGLSKIVSLKSKIAKKTKVQMMWDYLSYSQKPQTPAFVWRVEYTFK